MRGRQEIRLDSRQVGLLVASGVLMVLVAFSLGVLAGRLYFQEAAQPASVSPSPPSPQAAPTHVGVGPGLLPPLPTEPRAEPRSERGQETLPAGKAGAKGSSPSSGDQAAKETKPSQEEFTFYQTLTGKEQAPHVALQPKETPKESKAAKEAKKQPAGTAKKETEKTKTKVAKKEQPAKEPAGKRFSVQVGAFKERRDAEQLLLSLKDKGYSARLDVAELPGKGTWFRVRVGKFADRSEADQLVTKLQDQEKRPAIVVTE
ncbi:MAG: SPOR domain-containing protein [Nitrospirae bacterium]|nr:SPOR domain-containing protein [Nitrospirota bacterium]